MPHRVHYNSTKKKRYHPMGGILDAKRSALKLFFGGVAILALVAGIWFAGRFAMVSERSPDEEFMRAAAGITTFELNGTVRSVEGDALVIDVPHVMGVSVPDDAALRTRVVRVTFSTQLAEKREKTREELYRERRQAGDPLLVLPFVSRELALTDIKAGDFLRVSSGAHNIAFAAEIDAARVDRLMPRTPF